MVKLLIAAVCLLLIQVAGRAEEPVADPIKAKITAAKDAFHAERDKAGQTLIVLLEKKEATAKQAGDLKSLEAVRDEIAAFQKHATLPKLVPTTAYESALKIARTRIETEYATAMKVYTQQMRAEEVKQLQQQLDELLQGKKSAPPATNAGLEFKIEISGLDKPSAGEPGAAADPFQAKSIWRSNDNVLSVLERQGESFKANYRGPAFERVVQGTIKDKKILWLAKESEILTGDPGTDHEFVIVHDTKNGFRLVRMKDGKKSAYTLNLQQ
jgi:hypothetical protein